MCPGADLAKMWSHHAARGCVWYNMGAAKWQSAAGDVYYGVYEKKLKKFERVRSAIYTHTIVRDKKLAFRCCRRLLWCVRVHGPAHMLQLFSYLLSRCAHMRTFPPRIPLLQTSTMVCE
jgi:hypothetical protein